MNSTLNATLIDERENISDLLTFNGTYDVDAYLLDNWGPKHLPLDVVVPITVVYVLIFVSGLVGNVAVCAVIIRNTSMHTATNCYLFSLAVSDLTVLLFGLPNELSVYWQQYPWLLGETVCKLRAFITEMTNYASVLTIVAFSLERYLAICHPLHAYTMSGMERAGRIIALIWLVALISALPFAMYTGIIYAYIKYPGGSYLIPESAFCAMLDENRPSEWPLYEISTFIFFIVPMVVLCLLYLRIGIRIRRTSLGRGANNIQGAVHRGHGEANNSHSRRHILRMLVAVVIGFFICWAPFHAQRLLYVYGKNLPRYTEINEKMYYITGCFYYFSATINPILYNVMSARYREAFCETLCGCQSQLDKPRDPYADSRGVTSVVNGCTSVRRKDHNIEPETSLLLHYRPIPGVPVRSKSTHDDADEDDEITIVTYKCEGGGDPASLSPALLIRSSEESPTPTAAVVTTETNASLPSLRRSALPVHLNNESKVVNSGSLTAGCNPSCLKSSQMVRRLSERSRTSTRRQHPSTPLSTEELCPSTFANNPHAHNSFSSVITSSL